MKYHIISCMYICIYIYIYIYIYVCVCVCVCVCVRVCVCILYFFNLKRLYKIRPTSLMIAQTTQSRIRRRQWEVFSTDLAVWE
jgi:hypothetical protein